MATSIYDNMVPKYWAAIGFLSMKPLASWIEDLNDRIGFLNNWYENTKHPFILFLDRDMVFPVHTLERLRAAHARGQRHLLFVGRIEATKGADLKSIVVDETCDNCGAPMTVRKGFRGFFLGCSKDPKCKTTKEPSEATLEKITAATAVS